MQKAVLAEKQLGGIVRLILYAFVKSLSHFFVSKKNDCSLYTGAFAAQGQASSLRLSSNENARRIKPSSDEEGGTPQA